MMQKTTMLEILYIFRKVLRGFYYTVLVTIPALFRKTKDVIYLVYRPYRGHRP